MRFLILSLLVVSPLIASSDSLDDAIRTEMAKEGVPGLSFAVVRHGNIVRTGAYGYGSLEWKAKTTRDTKFEVGSVSKMIAGAAIRLLIEDGKVGLEDPISKYISGIPATWSYMKVRHLITMSTGFPEDWGGPTIPYNKDVVIPDDDPSLLKSFQTLTMVAPVGQRYSYSSVNYAMIGMIVSKVSGVSYADFVRQRIFDPLGMHDTSVIDDSVVITHRAEGYRKGDKGQILRGRYLGQYLHSRADDGIISTPNDYARFIIALQNGKLVKDLSALWEPTKADSGLPLDYSYGWIADTLLGHRREGHAGGYRTGFHTFVARYPDDDLSIIVFTNCDFSGVRNYVNMITRKYIKDLPDPEAESKTIDSDPADTQKLASFLAGASKGNLASDMMEPYAIEPLTLDDVHGFLEHAGTFTYAGRHTLPGNGILWHGARLVDFETLKTTIGGDPYHLTLYRSASGKIGWLELTN